MLYCPKCQRKYEEGTARFCLEDNTRLLPALASGSQFNQTGGVFANVLSRAASSGKPELEDKYQAFSKSGENEQKQQQKKQQPAAPTAFRPPATSKIFKDESEIPVKPPKQTAPPKILAPESRADVPNIIPPVQKTAPRPVKPSEIPNSQAPLGDRKTNPTGRLALTRKNTDVLLGQTIKGRYKVAEKISESETSVAYLAEDRVGAAARKVVVRILMDEEAADFFTNKTFAEERVSLSHFNHPNVAAVIDSGELPEGKPFIITEHVEGKTVKEMLGQSGQFNALRAARIIRQAAYALSETHRNGIPHRNLTAENVVLSVSENGTETVKLTGFGVPKGKTNGETLAYKAPEQVDGKKATDGDDAYSLAVIAFQMLTNRLPFDHSSASALLKSQREGLKILPTHLRRDVSPVVDEILQKALAFNPAERYPNARDFGDALFNHVTTAELWKEDAEQTGQIKIGDAAPGKVPKPAAPVSEVRIPATEIEVSPEISAAAVAAPLALTAEIAGKQPEAEPIKAASDLAWERRSPDLPAKAGRNWATTALLFIVILGALGFAFFAFNRPSQPDFVPTEPAVVSQPLKEEAPTLQQASPVTEAIESPPPSRGLTPPADSTFFENSKQNLKGETAKNFLGFALYYPRDWKRNDAKNNFLDISKNAASGTPVEQMLVSYYDSRGTFKEDKGLFPALVKDTNDKLKSLVPNYKIVGEGEKTVNNGWRAHEVKFEGAGKTAKGENIKLWGRRLFIPAARNGMKNGYVLTMLATSLSPDVKTVDDVGVKGDLHKVLYSFEPNQNF